MTSSHPPKTITPENAKGLALAKAPLWLIGLAGYGLGAPAADILNAIRAFQ